MEERDAEKAGVVVQVAQEMLARGTPILKAAQVQQAAEDNHAVDYPLKKVQRLLKEELGLRYRRLQKVPRNANTARCLVLRQRYALKMLELLAAGRRIINVDESWLSESNFSRQAWCKNASASSISISPVSPRLAVLAALDTDGQVWFALTHATTDSSVMRAFLGHLCQQLEAEDASTKETAVILLDGAVYHTGAETRETLRRLGIPTCYTGPYSYSSSPIELLFNGLKRGELNPMRHSLGKKYVLLFT